MCVCVRNSEVFRSNFSIMGKRFGEGRKGCKFNGIENCRKVSKEERVDMTNKGCTEVRRGILSGPFGINTFGLLLD